MIMNAHMENLLTRDSFIVDRSLIDGYIYTEWLSDHNKGVSPTFLRYAKYLMQEYIPSYDYIFYLPVEFPLVDDGVRSASKEYQDEITAKFESHIGLLLYRGNKNIHRLTGTVEQRVEQVLERMKA